MNARNTTQTFSFYLKISTPRQSPWSCNNMWWCSKAVGHNIYPFLLLVLLVVYRCYIVLHNIKYRNKWKTRTDLGRRYIFFVFPFSAKPKNVSSFVVHSGANTFMVVKNKKTNKSHFDFYNRRECVTYKNNMT